MKTKTIDTLNIGAIFALKDRDCEYIAIRKTHNGGHLEGKLFDDVNELLDSEELSDVYTKEELVSYLQDLIEKGNTAEDWEEILQNIYACSEWTDDKVISSWESVEGGNPCDVLEDKFTAYINIWGHDHQYAFAYDTETVIKSIALDAAEKTPEISYLGNFIDYANREVSTEIDDDDYVDIVAEHIEELLEWEENGEEVVFYKAEIEEDWKHLYVVNPKKYKEVIRTILELQDTSSCELMDMDYVEYRDNVICIGRDAFSEWNNGFDLSDLEKFIEKKFKEE